MNISETIKNSLKLYLYILIFSLIRIVILCILENQDVDTDSMTVSIIFFIFVILSITFIDYKFSNTTKTITDSLLNALFLNAVATSSSEVLMFIIPLLLHIIPFLNVFVDFILMAVPYVGTIITGILWGLSAAFFNIFITLSSSIKFLNYFKIIGLVILTIFNFVFDKINFIKSMRKNSLKSLIKTLKKPKNIKKNFRSKKVSGKKVSGKKVSGKKVSGRNSEKYDDYYAYYDNYNYNKNYYNLDNLQNDNSEY